MKILIVGCAKTGTTLLRRLMNAFHETRVYNWDEINIYKFAKQRKFNVAKRDSDTIFSNIIPYEEIIKQKELIRKKKIGIILIERNHTNVLKSDNGYVPLDRLISCMTQEMLHGEVITMRIRYEDVLRDPDLEQDRVARTFGLTKKNLWSEYPSFVDWEEIIETGIYKHRKIGEK